jgi:hypothetical protein
LKRELTMERKGLEKCVYCLERAATTREHIIARGFFHKQPPHHLTVPTCAQCNSGTGDGIDRPMAMDEEYVRTVFCLHAGSQRHSVADAIVWDKIARSFERRPGGLVKSLVESLSPAAFQHNGIIIPNQSTMGVDGARVGRVLRKITKGLYYHHNDVPLPLNCEVFASFPLPPEEFYQWMAVFRLCSSTGPYKFPGGEFGYMGMRDPSNHSTSLWLMTFYDRLPCLTITAHRNKKAIGFREKGRDLFLIQLGEPDSAQPSA